eukprot:gene7126-451_t
MPIGIGEGIVIGAIALTVFVGPKRVIPKVAEAVRAARQALSEGANTTAQRSSSTRPNITHEIHNQQNASATPSSTPQSSQASSSRSSS